MDAICVPRTTSTTLTSTTLHPPSISGNHSPGRKAFNLRNAKPPIRAVGSAAATATTAAPPVPVESKEIEITRNGKYRITQFIPPVPKSDFYSACVLSSHEVARDTKCIVVEAEISRELVKREHAYFRAGQLACVKIGEGEEMKVPVSSPPFPKDYNWDVLYKSRGDRPSGHVQSANSSLSVKSPLHLHVSKADFPQLYDLNEGDKVTLGPFATEGLDLKPVLFVSGFPQLIFFASGRGIAVAKAIIEAEDGDVGSLSLRFREESRLYYSASDPGLLAYKDKFEEWEEQKLIVCPTVKTTNGMDWDGCVGSLTKLWNEDDIQYDPKQTGVVICVESDDLDEVDKLVSDALIPEKNVICWDALYFVEG